MLKRLRSFALAVAMLLPFAAQAQNTLTVAESTATNSNVPIHGTWADAYLRCQTIYPASLMGISAANITQLTYYLSSPASEAWTGTWEIKMMEVSATTLSGWQDVSSATTVYTGLLDGTSSQLEIALATPYVYNGGNLLIEVNQIVKGNYKSASFYGLTASDASWQGYNSSAWSSITGSVKNFIPKTTFTYTVGAITCGAVKNLAVDPTLTTSSSLTFTWIDDVNTGATYSVYALNGTDTTLLQSGLTAMTYTATGLDANTVYTFGVMADCGATDGLSALRTVNGRTACGAMAIPYTTSFEDDATNAAPMCWDVLSGNIRVINGTPNSGSNRLDFRGTTDNRIALPAMAQPYSGLTLRFWERAESMSASCGYFVVGYMTDESTFVALEDSVAPHMDYVEHEIPLTNVPEGATIVFRQYNCSVNYYWYVDDVVVEPTPTCIKVGSLAAIATSTSITLTWNDTINTGATYSICSITGTDTAWFTTQDASYTFDGLPLYTNYAFTVRAICSDSDSSRVAAISTRTLRNECKMTAFNLTGNARREAPVMDTVAEPYAINAPVWYTDNLYGNATITWTISPGAAAFIDTTGDGSYTCQVTNITIKNYLPMNTPTTLRIKAEDRAIYTDYILTLETETCVAARNLQTAPERIRITATWDCPDTLVTEFHVLISETQLDAEALAAASYTVVNNAHEYTFEGLARETQYYIYAKGACDTTWLQQAVMTLGLSACETYDGSTGTSTSRYFFPGYYGFQYAGNLYNIDQSVGLTGISAYLATGHNSTGATLKVWVKEVGPDFVFTNTITFEEMTTGATLIFDGDASNLTTANVGWVQFPFSDVMNVTAGNQLLVLSRGTGCSTSGGCSRAERYTSKPGKMWYKQQDYNDPGMTTTGTVSGNRLNLQVCYTADACPEVTAISADSVTNNSAKIVWTASSADYCVGNQIIVSTTEIDAADLDAATSVTLDADAVSYNATGLTPDQDYYVYIKTLCNGNEHPEGTSGWATYQFRTFPTCRVPEIVSATVTGKHTAQVVLTNTGADLGQADNFSYILSTTLLSEADLASATATATGIDTTVIDLDNLASATTYYIYVQNVCPTESCSSPWSPVDSVITPAAMPAPVSLATNDEAHNALTASWVRDEANFADETAWRAAIALHGEQPAEWLTVETTIGNSAPLMGYNIFTGLLADTAYDIYVCAFDAATGLTSDTVRLDSVRTAVDPGNPTSVGERDGNNSYVPVYGNYCDDPQRSQSIYPASMLTDLVGKTITGIEYTVVNGGSTGTSGTWENGQFTVSIAMTEATDLATGWDLTATTTVYTGTLRASMADGMRITFDAPFTYTGGNLLVAFELPVAVGYSSCYFAGEQRPSASRRVHGDSYATAAGTIENFLPAIAFHTTDESSCYDVTTVYQTSVTGFTADITWIPGNQESAWQYVISNCDTLTDSELEAQMQNVNTNSVALTELLRDTNYTFYLRAACSETEQSRWTKWPFTTPFENFDVTVATAVNDAAMGTATGDTVVPDGTTVTLVATPATGHHFVSWSNGETTETIQVVAVTDTMLTATFAINTYTVAATAAEHGTVNGVPAEAVDYGTEVTLTAVPEAGYHFLAWLAGTDTVSMENPFTFTAISDTTLTAVFEANIAGTFTVSVDFDATMGTVEGIPTDAVDSASVVTLTAVAAEHYHFVEWSTGDTTATINVTVVSDTTLTALFAIDQHTVSAIATPAEAGSVEGVPTEAVDYGSIVSLTAVAAEGYHFVEWSTGETTETIEVTVEGDTTLTATFAINQYIVAAVVTPDASGSVSGVPAEAVDHGTELSLTAVPATGYHFVSWSNGATEPTIVITVVSDTTLTATFEANAAGTYTVSVIYDATMGTVAGVPTEPVVADSVITLVATPAEGYVFTGWSNGTTSDTLVITVTEDIVLTANFELFVPNQFVVSVSTRSTVMGTVDPMGIHNVMEADEFTVTATANEGYEFVAWMVGNDTVSTEATYTFTVTASISLVAVFAETTVEEELFLVTGLANDDAMGYVLGGGYYAAGATATLTAQANQGYRFVRWDDGNTTPYREITVTADVTVTAIFEAVPVGIEDAEQAEVEVIAVDNRIVVRGAESDIYLYDVNGRVLARQAAAATVEFTVNTAGVYLVKVGNAAAKRVSVVR